MYYVQGNIGNCGAIAAAYYIWASGDGFKPVAKGNRLNTKADDDLVNEIYGSGGVRLGTVLGGGKSLWEEFCKVASDSEREELLAAVDCEEEEELFSGGCETSEGESRISHLIKGMDAYSLPTGLRDYLQSHGFDDKNYEFWLPVSGENADTNMVAFTQLLKKIDPQITIQPQGIDNELLKDDSCCACIELVYVGKKLLSNLHYVLSFKNREENADEILYINPWCGYTQVRDDTDEWQVEIETEDGEAVNCTLIPSGAALRIRNNPVQS